MSDPRYVLLPSVSASREAFDEYCRDRARELRQSHVKKEKEDPMAEFNALLVEEVKSTRTSWGEFRRNWKKDRRFYGWGRDDKEREKRFREYIKDLGESELFVTFVASLFNYVREACRCTESRGGFLRLIERTRRYYRAIRVERGMCYVVVSIYLSLLTTPR